jgi:hypothetical protein
MSIEMECVCEEYTHEVKKSVYLTEEGGHFFISRCPRCGDVVKFFVSVELMGKDKSFKPPKEES